MCFLIGIREYHKGSWLKQHVDHVSTHVYSVIINVAQQWESGKDPKHGGVDWPVSVIDFMVATFWRFAPVLLIDV